RPRLALAWREPGLQPEAPARRARRTVPPQDLPYEGNRACAGRKRWLEYARAPQRVARAPRLLQRGRRRLRERRMGPQEVGSLLRLRVELELDAAIAGVRLLMGVAAGPDLFGYAFGEGRA